MRAVSAFMAETAATVFAVDQIDTLLAQSAATLTAPGAAESEVIEQVGHGLMSLRQGLYRTVTVACMLPTAWETLSSRATASVAARNAPPDSSFAATAPFHDAGEPVVVVAHGDQNCRVEGSPGNQ